MAPFRAGGAAADSIARILSAGTIVRGSVDQSGDRVSVSVQLIDGNTGAVLSRKGVEASTAQLLEMRDSVAADVESFLRQRVGDEVRHRELRLGTSSAAAWSLSQRAEQLRKDAEGAAVAGDSAAAARNYGSADSVLTQAERLDRAWPSVFVLRSTLALSRADRAAGAVAAKPWIDRGLAYADSALALDPTSAAALEMRGTLRYRQYELALYKDNREAQGMLGGAQQDLELATRSDPTEQLPGAPSAPSTTSRTRSSTQSSRPRARTTATRISEASMRSSGVSTRRHTIWSSSAMPRSGASRVMRASRGTRRSCDVSCG